MQHYWKTGIFSLLILLTASCSEQSAPSSTHSSNHKETASPAAHAVHWSYQGETGPEYWGSLENDFATCKKGHAQSPINIEQATLTKSSKLKPVEIHYKEAQSAIQNNGHTIQVSIKNQDNYIVLDGTKYILAQFHFHHPSEHQIDGHNAQMELHFVHKSQDGRSAVLGVLIEAGAENKAFEQIWNNLPTDESDSATELKEATRLAELLPTDLHSVRYTGSLTTPPCTEDVRWTVLDHPIQMSEAQIAKFATLFPDNHRPVQPLGERKVNTEGESR